MVLCLVLSCMNAYRYRHQRDDTPSCQLLGTSKGHVLERTDICNREMDN